MQGLGALIRKVVINLAKNMCFGTIMKLVVREVIPSQYVKIVVSTYFLSRHIEGIAKLMCRITSLTIDLPPVQTVLATISTLSALTSI